MLMTSVVVHSRPVRCETMTSNEGLQSRGEIITDLGGSGREGCDRGLLGVLCKVPFSESREVPCGPRKSRSKVPVSVACVAF